ncbi:DUF6234 family protein [Catellatospora sp. NPDC049111]|uniref:DUF6234 family protein n=1 Tax=Catellatospora sp. NPDC049111 TaxID=3155271 RepID=UPI0033C4A348
MSPTPEVSPRRAPNLSVAVVLAIVAWSIAICAMAGSLLSIGMSQWADSYDGDSQAMTGHAAESARAGLWLAAVLAAGPVLLAVLARAARMRKTFVVFVVLAVLLVPAGAVAASGSWRTLHPPAPPPPAPTHCVEHSGGDAGCPGG